MSANLSFQPAPIPAAVISTSSDDNNNCNTITNIFRSSTPKNCSAKFDESFAMNDLRNGHKMKIEDSEANQTNGNDIVDTFIDNNMTTENDHPNGDIRLSTSLNDCFETNNDNDEQVKDLPNNNNLTSSNDIPNDTDEPDMHDNSEQNFVEQTNGLATECNGEIPAINLMNGLADTGTEICHDTTDNLKSPVSVEQLNNSTSTNETNLTNSNNFISNGILSAQLSQTSGKSLSSTDNNSSALNNSDCEQIPFPYLAGEEIISKDKINEGFIYLTNFRLYLKPPNRSDDDNVYKNYRHQQQEQLINLPIGVIDSVEIRDLYYLVVFTKYVQSFVLTFQTSELATLWHRRLSDVHNFKIDDLFCFQYLKHLSAADGGGEGNRNADLISLNNNEIKLHQEPYQIVAREFKRMKFDAKSWKICDLNKDFKFSNTYPQYFILPKEMTDKDLEHVANFRYSRRIPVVVWRSKRNGCVIVRSSQPVVGWFGWRSGQDERLLEKILRLCNHDTQESYKMNKNDNESKQIDNHIVDNSRSDTSNCVLPDNSTAPIIATAVDNESGGNCANGVNQTDPIPNHVNGCLSPNLDNTIDNKINMNNGYSTSNGLMTNHNNVNSQSNHSLEKLDESGNGDGSTQNKLLILDARSYAAAFANRAMGGGSECAEYYLNCDVQYMGLNNIHSIRKSFNALRYICESNQIDQANWFTLLDNTKWFHNLASLLKAAVVIVDAISIQERPVLVHCSDGWDRTPQVIALAELMLDPYYRTIDGFKVLVEREWLQFGHKFADRCRSSTLNIDLNERCPVFLQWLDCVHQLLKQFPCEFQFNDYFLIKLVYHTYSCLFGTFTCNNVQERTSLQLYKRTISVWAYFELEKNNFINYLYIPKQEVLIPSCRVKDIIFWSDVYVPVSNTSTTNFIHYSDICNQPANNISVDSKNDLDSMYNEVNVDGIELNCNHEDKCKSLSKCDLTRSVSFENISKIKNISPNEHSNAKNDNFQSMDGDCLRLRLRYHSDSFLFEANGMSNDRDNFLSSVNNCLVDSTCDNDDSVCNEALNGFEDNREFANENEQTLCSNKMNSNVYPTKMNGLLNGRANGCGKMGPQDLTKFYENGFDYTNENCHSTNINNLKPGSPLQQQQSTSSAEMFDIDGQIIVKDKFYFQLQQFFSHQKREIDNLSYQLKLTRNRSNKSSLLEDSNISRKHSTRIGDSKYLRILSKHLEALDLNGCDNNHYDIKNSHNSSTNQSMPNRRLTVSNGDSPIAANRFPNPAFVHKKTPKDYLRNNNGGRRPRSQAECRPLYNE